MVSTTLKVAKTFIKPVVAGPKMKKVVSTLKGDSMVMSYLGSSHKVIISSLTSPCHCIDDGLLSLITHFLAICHHFYECGNLRSHYERLTTHSHVRVNVNSSSFHSLPCATPCSQRPHFYHFSMNYFYLCSIVSHFVRLCPRLL